MARTLFNLEQHGPEALGRAVERLPPGDTLTLTGSGLNLVALRGSPGFRLEMPLGAFRVEHDRGKLRARTTAPEELIKAHRAVMEEKELAGGLG